MLHNAIFFVECIEIFRVILPKSIRYDHLDFFSSLIFIKALKTLSLSNTPNLIFMVQKNCLLK